MTDIEKTRLESFERMLSEVLRQYDEKALKMSELKSEGKEKTATYRQLFAEKLQLGNIISLYKLYGNIE